MVRVASAYLSILCLVGLTVGGLLPRMAGRDAAPAGGARQLESARTAPADGSGAALTAALRRAKAHPANPDAAAIASIESLPSAPTDEAPTQQPPEAALAPDLSNMLAASALYAAGEMARADDIAAGIEDPTQRLALEWIALKSSPHPDYERLAAFGAAHPGWPALDWVRAQQEAALYTHPSHPQAVAALLANDPPRTPAGKLALARVERDSGHGEKAVALVRGLWRNEPLNAWVESALLSEFGPMLERADHQVRAERRLYDEDAAGALRAAVLAGPDILALAAARASALRGQLSTVLADRVPVALKGDPGLLFARIQSLRRADRVVEAAALLNGAPRNDATQIVGDRWWGEQRIVARRLLDLGRAGDAYALCARHMAASMPAQTDAEFLAGWIALRYLDRPIDAVAHFAAAGRFAATPWSISRADYWQGRAAEALHRPDDAQDFFERAAAYPIAYYGQLAADRIGRPIAAARAPKAAAPPAERDEAIGVVALLYEAKFAATALALALEEARSANDEAQLAALAQVLLAQGDALASVEVGKRAIERGFALDQIAFPTFGVPSFTPLSNSADMASIYAVTRQESEFAPTAASGAGAKGLMQLMPATAAATARRAGLPFDAARLTSDSVYNTQLGAAFLGQVLDDENGSAILAFAAYNAGGGRVQQWIKAYGDPRAGADPVDWVERIPYDETRDYVQRVSENLAIYRQRFALADAAAAQEPAAKMARAGGP